MHDDRTISTTWLAARLSVDPRRIDAGRRAGELLAVRSGDDREWLYPLWQFDAPGETKPQVVRALRAARERGIDGEALSRILGRRSGLVDGKSYRDLLLNGGEQRVLAELRSH